MRRRSGCRRSTARRGARTPISPNWPAATRRPGQRPTWWRDRPVAAEPVDARSAACPAADEGRRHQRAAAHRGGFPHPQVAGARGGPGGDPGRSACATGRRVAPAASGADRPGLPGGAAKGRAGKRGGGSAVVPAGDRALRQFRAGRAQPRYQADAPASGAVAAGGAGRPAVAVLPQQCGGTDAPGARVAVVAGRRGPRLSPTVRRQGLATDPPGADGGVAARHLPARVAQSPAPQCPAEPGDRRAAGSFDRGVAACRHRRLAE
ncbi:hypothetical protein L1887_46949 [Cichorium endivia]|nr:hypothetical protein L1887_46949 [Cichorium endivia]